MFVCVVHLPAVHRSWGGGAASEHLGGPAGSTGGCGCVGLAGSAVPQAGPGVRLAALTRAVTGPAGPECPVRDGDPRSVAAGSRRGHPGPSLSVQLRRPSPPARSGRAKLAPIGPGQAVTEAETWVMIGSLGREEVL